MKRPVRKTIRFRLPRGEPPRAPLACPFCVGESDYKQESQGLDESSEFFEYEEQWERQLTKEKKPGLTIFICAHHWKQYGDLGALEAKQLRLLLRDMVVLGILSLFGVLIPLWMGVPINSITIIFAGIATGIGLNWIYFQFCSSQFKVARLIWERVKLFRVSQFGKHVAKIRSQNLHWLEQFQNLNPQLHYLPPREEKVFYAKLVAVVVICVIVALPLTFVMEMGIEHTLDAFFTLVEIYNLYPWVLLLFFVIMVAIIHAFWKAYANAREREHRGSQA